MTQAVRPAELGDIQAIAPWTQDTFEWGDYVLERVTDWMEDQTSEVLVCTDEDDVAIALVHARMLSDTEGWLEGARVRPDQKRRGLGSILNHAGLEWIRSRGGRVVRLAIETDNEAARRQVEKLGYRVGSEWVTGFSSADPSFRAPRSSRLVPSSSADVDGAWMFWSTSELARAARGLVHEGWQWRSASVDDLKGAAAEQRLFQSGAGWVAFRDGGDSLETILVAGTQGDLPVLLEGIRDYAADQPAEHLVVKIPALDWASESLTRSGFKVKGILVYYKPV